MLLLYFIYFSLILFFIGIDIGSGRVCKHHRYNRYEYFCCENYERKQGKCIECEKGYLSMGFGEPCKQCKRNMYGFRCAESCHCKYNQRCDHVIGCLNVSGTHSNDTMILLTKDSSMLHVIITTADFMNNTGLHVKTVEIYTISVAVFTVAIILGLVIMNHYRKKSRIQKKKPNVQSQEIQQKNPRHHS